MTDTHQAPPADELRELFLKLAHDKKTRKTIAKAIREIAPDSKHAAAFADVDVEDKFEAFKREQEEAAIKRQQDEMLAQMNLKRTRLLNGDSSGRKYSEDDVKKIEELMTKKGISDYEDGATLYAATLPPVEPNLDNEPPQHGATWEMPEFAKFGNDPTKAARDTAHQVIGEFMRKKR